MTLSCRMDARPSGGVRASCPGSDRAALARPQAWFHAPSVISAALCLSCVGPSVRSVGMRWSNSAVVSCLALHWCSDRLAAHPRDKDKVVRGIDEVLLAKATFGVDARGYWLRQIDRD